METTERRFTKMKLKHINKVHQGAFITRYNIDYESEYGNNKTYEMISRNPEMKTADDLLHSSIDAVVMIIHNETGEKLLLNREFRMAVNGWVYNFPAGLIDKGETFSQAAIRELDEETGLKLVRIDDIWKESYSAVGFSNEKTVVVLGTAVGSIRPSDSDMEEIEAKWFTKEEVRQLLKDELFAARTQTYCTLWCKS